MGLKSRDQLDKDYLLTLLATLEPDHPWFAPGWTTRPATEEAETVQNDDGFFDHLPPSKSKKPGAAKVGRAPKVLTAVQANRRLEKQ